MAPSISARDSLKLPSSHRSRMKKRPVSTSACWSASRMLPSFLNTNSDNAATRPVRSRQLTSNVAVAGIDADETVEVMDLRISRLAAARRLCVDSRDGGGLGAAGGQPPEPGDQTPPDRGFGLGHRRRLNLTANLAKRRQRSAGWCREAHQVAVRLRQ